MSKDRFPLDDHGRRNLRLLSVIFLSAYRSDSRLIKTVRIHCHANSTDRLEKVHAGSVRHRFLVEGRRRKFFKVCVSWRGKANGVVIVIIEQKKKKKIKEEKKVSKERIMKVVNILRISLTLLVLNYCERRKANDILLRMNYYPWELLVFARWMHRTIIIRLCSDSVFLKLRLLLFFFKV